MINAYEQRSFPEAYISLGVPPLNAWINVLGKKIFHVSKILNILSTGIGFLEIFTETIPDPIRIPPWYHCSVAII